MKASFIALKDLFYIVPVSLALAALLSSVQSGNWWIGFLSFSFLFLFSLSLLKIAFAWSNAGRALGVMIGLAFFLRVAVGVTLQLALPVYGHGDEDDRAGYMFTDAHDRDDQAWTLATSGKPVVDAFNRRYASDQYGGLLAFNAFLYRYFSSDAQRPLLLILFSAFFAALGVPFMWKVASQVFGEPIAWASTWIFALYPESIMLGASAMREPYLLTFSTFAFWGFVQVFIHSVTTLKANEGYSRSGWFWIAFGVFGMLLVSPVVALVTIVIFAGWLFFTKENHQISWTAILVVGSVFVLGLFLLSSSLDRAGEFNSASPLHVVNDWLKSAVKWDAYQLERDSGWVQKILNHTPDWIHLPFITIYGIFQPVLPATIIHPTKLIWALIGFLRGLGWYALLPLLILSFTAATDAKHHSTRIEVSAKNRNLLLWLSLVAWIWILLAALRGGGDLFDNPRYRTILFVWQALLAGCVWV